jgi:hypothetical protein
MLIDCGQCEFRAVACGDCLVTVLVEADHVIAAAGGKVIADVIKT